MNAVVAQRRPQAPDVSLGRAKELSQSSLMPEHFHDNPANVQYVMEIGRSLGIDPVSALTHVHVWEQDGKLKCGLSADLMVALARNAGHLVHVTGTPAKATATLIRDADNSEKIDLALKRVELLKAMGLEPQKLMVFTEVWTQERAQEIGLMRKFNWKNYTPEMLKARVKSAVVRSGASEVLMGIAQTLRNLGIELSDEMDEEITLSSARYTADEMGAETDEDGFPLRGASLQKDQPQPTVVASTPAPAAAPQTPAQKPVVVQQTAAPQQAPAATSGVPIPEPIRTFVRESTPNEIVEWATNTSNDGSKSAQEKLNQLQVVHAACAEAKKLHDKATNFPEPDSPGELRIITVGKALVSYAQPLMETK